MSDPSLQQIEREVEAARAKLAGDLATLRSPATYSEFTSDLKSEALEMKDALVDKAKSSVQSTFENFVDDMKARAAANPAATLAIGAGIAWRLIQHPPIATALIGAGLYSLFRTSPLQPTPRDNESFLLQARERLAEQASDLADNVRQRASAMGEAATEKASELATEVKMRAANLGEAATDKATELASAAKDQVQHWSSQAQAAVQHAVGTAGDTTGHPSGPQQTMHRAASSTMADAVSHAGAAAKEWSRPLQETVSDQESRDRLLLGAAGVAVIAAVGMAYQRRLTESSHAD